MKYLILSIVMFLGCNIKCNIDISEENSSRSKYTRIITNPKRSDGFGGQLQTIIASVIYAELHNVKYIYTPFRAMAHNYHNDDKFLAKKEWLINFINHFEINTNYNLQHQISPQAYIGFFEHNLSRCAHSKSLKIIKRIFRSNKNLKDYYNPEYFNIAIHIRRPNSHDNRTEGTDTPDEIFIKALNKLSTIYASNNPLFHVYSQGNEENFKIFESDNIIFHLNESIEETFTSMVFADVLVIGASSFSYSAGLLSDGIVYYIPFWHPPLPHWKSINSLS